MCVKTDVKQSGYTASKYADFGKQESTRILHNLREQFTEFAVSTNDHIVSRSETTALLYIFAYIVLAFSVHVHLRGM